MGASRCLCTSRCAILERSQPETRGWEETQGEGIPPNPHGHGKAATPQGSPLKTLLFKKPIPSWKSQRGAAAVLSLAPQAGSWGCPQLPTFPNPACIFGSLRAHRALRFSSQPEQSTPLSSAPRAGRCWIALPNPDQHLLVPARQLSCQHMPGWPQFPAPPPAPSFKLDQLSTRRKHTGALFQLAGC